MLSGNQCELVARDGKLLKLLSGHSNWSEARSARMMMVVVMLIRMIFGITWRFIVIAVANVAFKSFLTRCVAALRVNFMSSVQLIITTGVGHVSRHAGHQQSGINAAQ